MFRRVLALVFVAALAGGAALAQPVLPLLRSTAAWPAAFLSLAAVQVQVDASLTRAAASKDLIAVAVALMPPPVLPSTPIPRR